MIIENTVFESDRALYKPMLERLKTLFKRMGEAYTSVAEQYEFHCTGCKDNCCLTRFHHHTLMEYLYIREGFETLPPDRRVELKHRAKVVLDGYDRCDEKGEIPRLLCPLNEKGLCVLYTYRPMICRLHGISHELCPPGRVPIRNPGCEEFTIQSGGKAYIRFDRTPFYMEMASLEKDVRQTMGFTQKVRMTISDILIDFE